MKQASAFLKRNNGLKFNFLTLAALALLSLVISPQVSAQQDVVFTGPEGGPFSPDSVSFGITDCGEADTWRLEVPPDASWLTLSPASGPCNAPPPEIVAAWSINSSANALPPENYTVTLQPEFLLNGQPIGTGAPIDVTLVVEAKPNQPPECTIVDPSGPVTISAGESVNFTGTVSDPDGDSVSIDWTFPGGTPSASTVANPGEVRFDTPGTSTVTLRGSDDSGASCSDQVDITIEEAPNQPPEGTITSPSGPVTIEPGQSVTFAGSGSDPDDDLPLTFSWDFDGAAPPSNEQNPGAIIFSDPGTYKVTLTVTDAQGLADPAPPSVTITVGEVSNQPPECTIIEPSGPVTINAGESVNFTSAVSDPDGDTVAIEWTFPGGEPSSSTEQNPGPVRFATPGTSSVTLQGDDGNGGTCDDSVIVTVDGQQENQPPTGTITSPSGPVTIEPGQSVTFAGSGSDPDGDLPLTYLWEFPGGDPSSSNEQNPGAIIFSDPGTYKVTLTVTDAQGLADPAPPSVTITVGEAPNQPPECTIIEPSGPVTINAGESVNFTSAVSDPDGDTVAIEWTFPGGEPSSSTEQNPGQVRFATPGASSVTLQGDDGRGGFCNDQVSITVRDGGGPSPSPCEPGDDECLKELQDGITDTLLQFSTTEAQASISRVIGAICPDGAINGVLSEDLQRDCNALVGAAVGASSRATDTGGAGVSTALGEIAPIDASIAVNNATNGVGAQLSNIAGRITALRSGAMGFSLAGLNLDINGTRVSGSQIASFFEAGVNGDKAAAGGGAAADSDGFSRLGGFVSGDFRFGDKDATDREEGFDFDAWGITVGVDYRFSDKLIAGAAFGYSTAKTDVDNNGGDLDADGYVGIIYGSYYHNEKFFVDGSLSFGSNDFDQKRKVRYSLDNQTSVNQSFSADYDGDQFAVALSAGYQYSKDAFTFTPSGRLQYIKADVDGYREDNNNPNVSGSGWNVEIDDQEFKSFTLSLGGQVTYAMSQSWGVLLPYAGVEWIYEFEDGDDNVSGRFVGDSTNTSFFLPTDELDSNYFNLNVGVSAQFSGGKSGFINYEQILGYQDLSSYRINAGFRYEF